MTVPPQQPCVSVLNDGQFGTGIGVAVGVRVGLGVGLAGRVGRGVSGGVCICPFTHSRVSLL